MNPEVDQGGKREPKPAEINTVTPNAYAENIVYAAQHFYNNGADNFDLESQW